MVKAIEISKIYSNGNVRNEKDDSILELMDSIEKHGLIQPIAVRKTSAGYEVIAGHRRLEAVKRLGEPFIDCNILEEVDDKDRFVMQLEENIQRKQMSAYEIVMAIDTLVEKFGCTDKQLARMLHKSDQWISDNRYAVKLLEKEYKGGIIPEDKKKLSAGVIKAQERHKVKTDTVKINGNGFSVKQHGHTYMFYCSSFEFEEKLNELIKQYQ